MGLEDLSVIYHHRADVVACELEGGKALLDLESSNYFKLNDTAALIWEWIGEGASVAQLIHKITDRFDIGEEECAQDVEAIVSSFEENGLVDSQAG